MVTLKPCRECGHEVSTKAISCPNCGAPIKGKHYFIKTMFIVIIIVGVYYFKQDIHKFGLSTLEDRFINNNKVSLSEKWAHNTINVREGPGKNYSVVHKLQRGDIVEISEENKYGWAPIYKNGNIRGYVFASLLFHSPVPETKKKENTKKKTKNMIQFYLNNIDYRAAVTATGNPCPEVTHKSWTGKDESSGKRFVSVSCSNGSNYMVTLPANDEGRISVLECGFLEAFRVRCFEKFNDKF